MINEHHNHCKNTNYLSIIFRIFHLTPVRNDCVRGLAAYRSPNEDSFLLRTEITNRENVGSQKKKRKSQCMFCNDE